MRPHVKDQSAGNGRMNDCYEYSVGGKLEVEKEDPGKGTMLGGFLFEARGVLRSGPGISSALAGQSKGIGLLHKTTSQYKS